MYLVISKLETVKTINNDQELIPAYTFDKIEVHHKQRI